MYKKKQYYFVLFILFLLLVIMIFKNLSSKLRKPGLTELLALLVFIVFIPSFFVSDEIMNGTRMAKEFGLSITLAIVLPIALILWTIYNWKDLSIGITKIDILVAIFAAYCGFLVWYHGYTDRIEIKFYMYGSAYILFRMFFSSFKKNTNPEYSWKNPRVYFPVLLSLILSAHCIIGLLQLYGVLNSYHAYFQVTGMFFNPAPYAGFLIALSPLCIATYIELKKHKEKWGKGEKVAANLLLASFILTLSVLPVTQSRAAWVAFAGAMAFLVWRYYPVKEWWSSYFPKTWMKVTGISLATVLLVATVAGLYYYKKDSADGRLFIWKTSVKVIKKNIILGIGFGNFENKFAREQSDYFRTNQVKLKELDYADEISYPYNELIGILVTTGIVGFSIIILLSILIVISLNKIHYFILIIPILLFSIFSYPFYVECLFVLLILGIVGMSEFQNYLYVRNLNVYFLVTIISSIIYLTVIINEIQTLKEYKKWNMASLNQYNTGEFNKALIIYNKIFYRLRFNSQFLIEYAIILNRLAEYRTSLIALSLAEELTYSKLLLQTKGDNYFALQQTGLAETNYNNAKYISPNSLYPHYLLFQLYKASNQETKAIKEAVIIINMKIKVVSPATIEMKNEMKEFIDNYGD